MRTSVGALPSCNLESPGAGFGGGGGVFKGIVRARRVCEMGELRRVALNAESRCPLSLRVVLKHKSDGLAPLLKIFYNRD